MTKYYHICSERSWRYNKRSNAREQEYLNNKIIVKNTVISQLREKLKENVSLKIHYDFLSECYNTTYNNFQTLYNTYTNIVRQLNESNQENEKYKKLIEEVNETLNQKIENYESLYSQYQELKKNYEEFKVKIEVN